MYAALVLASQAYQRFLATDRMRSDVPRGFELAPIDAAPGIPRAWTLPLRVDGASPCAIGGGRPAVLLIHGSPGGAGDFKRLIPSLTEAGYDVIAPDLLQYSIGRGMWSSPAPASRSIESFAAAIHQALERRGVDRMHVVGWSNGGGVAMHLAARDPSRVASLTLMSSIGLQRYEWSGSHAFEHAKYALGYALAGALPELLPHFGVLGRFDTRTAWLDYFEDSDQRPLESLMTRLRVPTLILHGRDDSLVPIHAARAHHDLIPDSRLVVLHADHFLPFLQHEEASAALLDHFRRHDAPGATPRAGVDDRTRGLERRWWARAADWARDRLIGSPLWLEFLVLGALVAIAPMIALVVLAWLVARAGLDPAVAISALVLGTLAQALALIAVGRVLGARARSIPRVGARLPDPSSRDWRRRLNARPAREGARSQFLNRHRAAAAIGCGLAWREHPVHPGRVLAFVIGRSLGAIPWAVATLVALVFLDALALGPLRTRLGTPGAILSILALYGAARLVPALLTRAGRQHLLATIDRIKHHEYWPTWLFYVPLQPYTWLLAFRHGGYSLPTCCNPEIGAAGGWAGESKHAIMSRLHGPGILATRLVSSGAIDDRLRALDQAMRTAPGMEYPVILKPDQGQRGHAVKLARSREDARGYLGSMTGDAVAQPYHPGPHECGVLWTRTPGREGGTIYAITRKEFPSITGDGERTLEELILGHPRYRRQARVFLDRFAHDASRVLAPGEVLRLAIAGNHCQGTLFRDGEDLRTPDLEAAIDRLARSFPRLDVGRFDIRYESDDRLREGRAFGVVELNGITSEPTNMYDPGRGPSFAYRVLFGLWRRIYELGAERRAQGVAPTSLLGVLRLAREQSRTATGSPVAD